MEPKLCQSCGMPLDQESLYGTEADGSKSEEYCCYCYENGAFKTDETMEQMAKTCAGIMAKEGVCKTEEEAYAMMMACLPELRRWKKEAQ